MNRFRTDVENLLLAEMVEEDNDFIMTEDTTYDDMTPENTMGLFDDVSSEDDLDSILLGDDDDSDLFGGI